MPLRRQSSTDARDWAFKRFVPWCVGLNPAMSDSDDMVPNLWQMLPAERQRVVLVTLGQMTVRRLRSVSAPRGKAYDGERLCVGARRSCVGQDCGDPSQPFPLIRIYPPP